MYTYIEAYNKLEKPIKKDSKKIGNNTTLRRDGSVIQVRLHNTDVVTITPTFYILNSGGWRTLTTKVRINRYSPAYITQKAGIWYIDNSIFYDGIKINLTGQVISKRILDDSKIIKYNNAWKVTINKYITRAIERLKKGTIKLPSGGDCWHCLLTTDKGDALGEAMKNHDHLKSHIEDKYIVPSMIWNAVKIAGYQYPEVIIGITDDKKHFGGSMLSGYAVKRSLYKYLTSRICKKGGDIKGDL
jgi:hypothetical protein